MSKTNFYIPRAFATLAVWSAAAVLLVAVGCENAPSTTDSATQSTVDEAQTTAPSPAIATETPATQTPATPTTQTPTTQTPANQAPANQGADAQTPDNDSGSQSSVGAAGTIKPFTAKALMWNVESEGSDSEVVASQLSELSGYDIYALTEVLSQDFDRFENACGEKFDAARTRTGNNDRMEIIYNTDRFELIRRMELDEINHQFRYRSPLVVHLRERETGSEFLVMVNHLARGKEEIRQQQAEQLVEWAREQNLPILALGDYNFDYVFETELGNDSFAIFMRDGIFKWIKPVEMIDTNWYDPEPDGIDNYPGSMLDFAFVAQAAMEWDCECKVIVRDGDFPDNEKTSDHRPVEVTFTTK